MFGCEHIREKGCRYVWVPVCRKFGDIVPITLYFRASPAVGHGTRKTGMFACWQARGMGLWICLSVGR